MDSVPDVVPNVRHNGILQRSTSGHEIPSPSSVLVREHSERIQPQRKSKLQLIVTICQDVFARRCTHLLYTIDASRLSPAGLAHTENVLKNRSDLYCNIILLECSIPYTHVPTCLILRNAFRVSNRIRPSQLRLRTVVRFVRQRALSDNASEKNDMVYNDNIERQEAGKSFFSYVPQPLLCCSGTPTTPNIIVEGAITVHGNFYRIFLADVRRSRIDCKFSKILNLKRPVGNPFITEKIPNHGMRYGAPKHRRRGSNKIRIRKRKSSRREGSQKGTKAMEDRAEGAEVGREGGGGGCRGSTGKGGRKEERGGQPHVMVMVMTTMMMTTTINQQCDHRQQNHPCGRAVTNLRKSGNGNGRHVVNALQNLTPIKAMKLYLGLLIENTVSAYLWSMYGVPVAVCLGRPYHRASLSLPVYLSRPRNVYIPGQGHFARIAGFPVPFLLVT